MPVAEFLKRHNDNPHSTLDGKIVHPMNVIDIPLDYIVAADEREGGSKRRTASYRNSRKCGSVVELPTEVIQSSLGHKYQKFIRRNSLDLTSAHSKYLLLSEAGAYTEPHEDMSGSNVFYALLAGEKVFHVYYRDQAITEAIRTMCPEKFDKFLSTRKHAVYHVHAGQGMMMPGNLVHRVYTIIDSVAIGCNFLVAPQMKNALRARQWEIATVKNESSKPLQLKELKESNLFINFEEISAIYIFDILQYYRLNPTQNETVIKKQLKQIIGLYKDIISEKTCKDQCSFFSSLENAWDAKFILHSRAIAFDWNVVEEFVKTGLFM